MKTVVLSYSGGLDTSCILVWLIEKGYDVIAFMFPDLEHIWDVTLRAMEHRNPRPLKTLKLWNALQEATVCITYSIFPEANLGQEEDFDAAFQKAKGLGAKKVIIEDLRETFLEDYVWPAIQSGALFEERHLQGHSIARPCIAKSLVAVAMKEKTNYIAHGATGKGNDQLGFELPLYALCPDLKIIAPWRLKEFYERFPGRPDLFEFAKQKNIPLPITPSSPWSIDANLMHTSYESGILEDPWTEAPEDLFLMTKDPVKSPDQPSALDLEFKEGVPVKVTNLKDKVVKQSPIDLYVYLNKIGGLHGIGRIDIVENTFNGVKYRALYETPGGTIIHAAHLDLEIFTLDQEVYRLKKNLSLKFGDLISNGLWFSPESNFIQSCVRLSQKDVNGTVRVLLYKGHVQILARKSPTMTFNMELQSLDATGDYNPNDAEGYIKSHALRLKEYFRAKNKKSYE